MVLTRCETEIFHILIKIRYQSVSLYMLPFYDHDSFQWRTVMHYRPKNNPCTNILKRCGLYEIRTVEAVNS